MIRLFSFLLTGCWHHWEIIREVPIRWSDDLGSSGIGTRYTLQCKHCGEIKRRNIR